MINFNAHMTRDWYSYTYYLRRRVLTKFIKFLAYDKHWWQKERAKARILRKIDGPDSCACAKIQDSLWVFNGGDMSFTTENQAIDMMKQVQAVLFLLIIWLSASAMPCK